MSDIAIRVEGLGKRYRIGASQVSAENTLGVLGKLFASPFSYLASTLRPPSEEEIVWALQDVSFEVKRGEVLGVIGHNGAGKSTLLKILSGITDPTTGYAELFGRVGSLLEVGTGFHPDLTGRENVYMNGTILGMTKAEIDRKFDEIVEFSGVEKFIDTRVKYYSSGMNVRLGFAVAAHLDPEVLLVDEVLSVGDAEFRQRSLGKIGEVVREGRTVLFVSHHMSSISRLCERVLWFDNGTLRLDSPTDTAISSYLMVGSEAAGERVWVGGIANPNVKDIILRAVRVKNDKQQIASVLDIRHPFWIEMEYEVYRELSFCRVGIIISTMDGIDVFHTYDTDDGEFDREREPGVYVARCKVPGNFLNARQYRVSVNIGVPYVRNLVNQEGALMLTIEEVGGVGSDLESSRSGVVRPLISWDTDCVQS